MRTPFSCESSLLLRVCASYILVEAGYLQCEAPCQYFTQNTANGPNNAEGDYDYACFTHEESRRSPGSHGLYLFIIVLTCMYFQGISMNVLKGRGHDLFSLQGCCWTWGSHGEFNGSIKLYTKVDAPAYFFEAGKSTVFITLQVSIRVQMEATQTKVWVEHSSIWPLEFHAM